MTLPETVTPFNKIDRDPRDEHLVGEVLGTEAAEDMQQLAGSRQADRRVSDIELTKGEQETTTRIEKEAATAEERRRQYYEWAEKYDLSEEWVDERFNFLDDGSVETNAWISFHSKAVTSLPPGLKRVRGNLIFTMSGIRVLSSLEGIKIDGDLELLQLLNIDTIPSNIDIGGVIWVNDYQKELIADIKNKGYKYKIQGLKK